MSYTPTTWTTGDTITATKLNKIENGIANAGGAAVVKLTKNGPEGTFTCGYGYIRQGQRQEMPDFWSLESSFDKATSSLSLFSYNEITIATIPFDPQDEFTSCIIIEDVAFDSYTVTTTGGVSSEYVIAQQRSGQSSWISTTFYCYIITGDGTITFTPK